jgi:transcriptional regulator of acetoin/glycerol metabolism
MTDEKRGVKTDAERLLFQLQLLGVMAAAGRDEERDRAYVRAQELAQQLIAAEKRGEKTDAERLPFHLQLERKVLHHATMRQKADDAGVLTDSEYHTGRESAFREVLKMSEQMSGR